MNVKTELRHADGLAFSHSDFSQRLVMSHLVFAALLVKLVPKRSFNIFWQFF